MTKKARSVTNWFHGKQIKPKCEHKYDYQHTVVWNTEKETGISRNTILWTFIDLSYASTSIFSWCVIINTVGSNIMTRPLHQYRRGYGFKFLTGLNFFSGLISTTGSVVFITARIDSIFVSLTAVHIYDFHIFIAIIHYLEGCLDPTWWPPPSWLVSSVGRVLQIPYGPELFSGLISTISLVVFITTGIDSIFEFKYL